MSVTFKVPGKVKGKARARTYYDARAGRHRSITPSGTVEYENSVRLAWSRLEERGWFQGEALAVTIIAYYEIPKSTTKRDRGKIAAGELHPTKKPDADNIAKAICDALNGLAYHDDAQIVMLMVLKRYTEGLPYALIGIKEVNELMWSDQ